MADLESTTPGMKISKLLSIIIPRTCLFMGIADFLITLQTNKGKIMDELGLAGGTS